jgi:Gram-negative bacterial TonB protein C-terminal
VRAAWKPRFLFLGLCCATAAAVSSAQETAESQQLVKVPMQIMSARLLTTVTPERPKTPMAKCSNRMVTLDVVIGEDGRVKNLKVLGGFREFQESSLTAVKQWTYDPYVVDGAPTAVETKVLIFYPSSGKPGPAFVPDGKGGVKGGDFLPLPPECGPPITVPPASPQ